MSVDSIFSETGPLARAIPGYRPRAGQLLMAHTVEGALSREEVLAVEAPCGVGKSLAYLIPAITLAVERNQRVIVSTGMISLQEQLLGKDLPMLRDALPYDFTFALAKGKSNFLCRHRLAEPDELLVNSQENAEHLERLLQWAEATVTGDKAHVTDPEGKPWSPPEEVWAMVTSGSDECLGKACPHREGCFYEAAKRRWKTARIVVCNHHLLVLDLLMGGIILGEAGAVIVDEAHRLPDSARGALGYEVGFGSVARLAARVAAEGHEEAADDLRAEGRAFFEQLTAYRLTPKTYKARIRVPGVVDTQPLLSALGWAREKLRAEEASIDTSDPCCDDDEKERRALLHKLAERCGDISERIHNAISLVDPQQIVTLDLPKRQRGRAKIVSRPADVGPPLGRLLLRPERPVVFTSATLATSDGFGWFLSQVGADNATTLEVPSPFDFRCQAAMLVSPASMPIPDWKHPQVYRDAAAREVREIVRFTEGRTLALFTSWESLRAAKAALTGCPYRVLAQGDMPPHKLLAAFQHDVQSVLLAVASFWEGIDVQGPALTTLIVDRLPFPVRDDPMSDWLSSTPGRNEWTEYRFPVACLKLTQGVGRLIRSVSDRGLVVLLDPRLRGMPYGRALLRRLPRMYHVDRLEDAAPWVLDNVLPMRAAR